MLSITLKGGNGLLKAAWGSCAPSRTVPNPTNSIAMNSRLENTLALGLMLPPLRASLHLIEAQQIRDALFGKSALFDRHFTHRAPSFIGFFGDRRCAIVANFG